MFLTRKHLSRRTLLKGAGASIALPLLDAMVPANTALAQTAAAPSPRLGFVYFPHGALQDEWQPKQTGRTNVVTMKMVEEASMRTYPHLGVHEAFHPTSHWGGFPERIVNLRKIQNWHTQVFAKFAQRLASTPDGDGNVLDHSLILFGSNMANSDAHNNDPLPQALIGRGGGVKGGQHLHYKQDSPHANILVTMLEKAGIPGTEWEKFADATGPLSEV